MTPAQFLHPLPPADQSVVMARMRPWVAPADVVLYKVGQHVPGLWMLDAGLVRYEFVDDQGRQLVPAFSAPGACFGELEILEARVASVSAVTAMPCKGWVMSASDALEIMDTLPAFSKLMLLKLARNVRLSQMLYQMALVLGQHERLALALLNLARPTAGPDGQESLVVAVTQETLCQVTGSSRQLVSKYLRQWTDQGWVAPRYRSLEILDASGLKSIFPPTVDPELFVLLHRTARGRISTGRAS
jgi:CRP/FNR family transcriptional regulator, cyclic AMP receptor protein